jgi:hypothetical protein
MRFVLIPKFCELSGYTEKAIERKIADGVWRQGHEYRKSPDGRIQIDLQGYEKWVLK